MTLIRNLQGCLLLAPLAAMALAPAYAQDSGQASSISEALAASKPIFALRLRYEGVAQDGLANDADAVTWRARAGLETGTWKDTSFLIDFDLIEDLVDDFNSTINGKTVYPVVPDPSTAELNRLQITNTSIPDTRLTIGRQRIILDDARFVGNVGWRQNEQTFDAVRAINSSFGDLAIDVAYVAQVNRIFGEDSAQGRFTGDSYLVNVSHPTPIGRVTGFAYLVDVEEGGGANSSQTYGMRLAGDTPLGGGKLAYVGSYAIQSDYGSSNLAYEAPYYLASATYSNTGFSFGLGYEALGGDTARGFSTPLATLHAYQGWADKFLGTPAAGIEDLYGSAGYTFGDIGPLKGLKLTAIYHDFSAETLSQDYGTELDVALTARFKSVEIGLKYADYDADTFAADTSKIWFSIDYAL